VDFLSVRLITDDVRRLVEFYEQATGLPARWATDDFAELVTPACTLALASTRTVQLFGEGAARPADNHSAIIEFRVDDVDKNMRSWSMSSASLSKRRRRCRGATGRCCSATLTAIW
jgi:hypothetical protein